MPIKEDSMKKAPIPVPAAVFEGLEAVRLTGASNMLDRPRVIELAEMMGYDDTAEWLRNNTHLYAELIFCGMVVEEEGLCAD